jgi:hypothetical protein
VGIDTGEDSTLVDTTNGNSAPVVGPLAAIEVLSGGRSTLPIAAVASDDDDLTELTWSLDAGTGIDVAINNGTLTIQILESFSGQTFLGLTATDSFGAQDSTILTVNVSTLVSNPSPGDFSRDGRMDFDDFFLFVDHLGLATFHRDWDPVFDLTEDGRIDLNDFFAFVELFHAARAAR